MNNYLYCTIESITFILLTTYFRVRIEGPDTDSMNELMDSISYQVTCTDDIVNKLTPRIHVSNSQQHITKVKANYFGPDATGDMKTQNRFSHLDNMCGWNIEILDLRQARKRIRAEIDENEKQVFGRCINSGV